LFTLTILFTRTNSWIVGSLVGLLVCVLFGRGFVFWLVALLLFICLLVDWLVVDLVVCLLVGYSSHDVFIKMDQTA